MLADPRADALVSNFVGQWLFLRNLPAVLPDPKKDPDFDEDLRAGFRRETELFAGSILRENRSVLDLLTADYTFVNERLAKHYGIPNVRGTHFRRVELTDDNRRGLLGQGSMLSVTSMSESDVSGRARQMDSREPARHAAPAAAARCAGAEEKPRTQTRKSSVDARAHRAASRQPGVRELPRDDGSAGPLAREFRFRRQMAGRRRGAHADRRVGHAA